ncbi:MAG: hypothetical protein AAGH43_01250 [Pseudomonadota bacterium]
MLIVIPPLPSSGTVLYFFRGFLILGAIALAGLFLFRFFQSYAVVLQTGVWWMAIPMLVLTALVIWLSIKKRFWFAAASLIPLIAINFYVQSAWQGQIADADTANIRAASYVEAIVSSLRGHGSLAPQAVRDFSNDFEWVSGDFTGVPERDERAYNHDVIFGNVNDFGVGSRIAWPQGTGSQGFLDAYEPLRQAHGDWLGLIADCELRLDPRVVTGGFCTTASGILESYGVDLRAAMEAFMASQGGMSACDNNVLCTSYARRYGDFLVN